MDLEAKMEERALQMSRTLYESVVWDLETRRVLSNRYPTVIWLAFRAGYMACLKDTAKSGSDPA